jgi:hypothetical protein
MEKCLFRLFHAIGRRIKMKSGRISRVGTLRRTGGATP